MAYPELAISDEVKRVAIDYVKSTYLGPFQRDGGFNGKQLERIMGHIGELMTKGYLGFTNEQMGSMTGSLQADRHDFRLNRYTFDVKTSYSFVYKRDRKPPGGWGLLIPNAQWNFRQHDFYIRCLVDGETPDAMTTCLFLCACRRYAVNESPVEMLRMNRRNERTSMRVVPPELCFEIEVLKQLVEYYKKEATGHEQEQHVHTDGDGRRVVQGAGPSG